jgi:hypothetical protein
MRISRTSTSFACALTGTFLFSPVWGFEVLYHYGVHGEVLPPEVDHTPMPSLVKDALWVVEGGGTGIEPLWVGNFFRSRNPATASIADRILRRNPSRRVRRLEQHLRLAAVTVWLSRHATEAELKQSFARLTYFGRRAWGASDVAKAFFERPVESLTISQISLLAGLLDSPSRYDPTCHPEHAAKRRGYVLARLRDSGVISRLEHETALKEPIDAIPPVRPCSQP